MNAVSRKFVPVRPPERVDEFITGTRPDAERRHGRGAETNRSGRFEREERQIFDDGWGSVDFLPEFKTEVQEEKAQEDPHHQRFAGHFLRSVDQSLSRLRAWLQLLLRPADPRLYGPLAGPRFRDQAVRQADGGEAPREGTGAARLRAEDHRHRHQHRSLPADRAALPDHARDSRSARRGESPGRHRHQIGAGAPRRRYPGAHGRARPRQGGPVGDHARPAAGSRDGAAGGDAAAASRRLAAAFRSGRADHGHGRADHSRRSTSPSWSASSTPRRLPASRRRAMCCFACRSR